MEALERILSTEEIRATFNICDSSKAVGMMGLTKILLKKFWSELEEDICRFIINFFEAGRFPTKINLTLVVLIPKFEGAIVIKDYRPISMVGCLYKKVTKVLASHLKEVMPGLVGEMQSAFIKDRQILDGTLKANEIVWWLRKAKEKVVLLKLDFQKAYDTVRWCFLKKSWTIWGLEEFGGVG